MKKGRKLCCCRESNCMRSAKNRDEEENQSCFKAPEDRRSSEDINPSAKPPFVSFSYQSRERKRENKFLYKKQTKWVRSMDWKKPVKRQDPHKIHKKFTINGEKHFKNRAEWTKKSSNTNEWKKLRKRGRGFRGLTEYVREYFALRGVCDSCWSWFCSEFFALQHTAFPSNALPSLFFLSNLWAERRNESVKWAILSRAKRAPSSLSRAAFMGHLSTQSQSLAPAPAEPFFLLFRFLLFLKRALPKYWGYFSHFIFFFFCCMSKY